VRGNRLGAGALTRWVEVTKIGKWRVPKRKNQVQRAVVVDCISTISPSFIDLFRKTLATIEIDRAILVELKRATISDRSGLEAMAAALDERLEAGGRAAFLTATHRSHHMLRQIGVPEQMLVTNADSARMIILAEHSTGTRG